MRPSIRQLEYAVAVADERHFRRAAQRCAVTQPALSAQIAQLEDLLGVQLFERDRRGVLLTPQGEAAIARARDILARVDELCDVARGARPLTGPLRLGVIPTIAPYLLPRVLPAVREAYPELQLLLREEQTARLLEQLDLGKLDLLLLALPVEHSDAAVTMDLFDEPFVLAAPRGHALARGRQLSETDLSGAHVLLLEDGHCLRDHALSVCRLAGAEESADVQATSLNTLTQMVANGLGVTLLPQLAVPAEGGDPQVTIRRFRNPPPTRTIGLMWRRTSARADEYRLFGELVQRTAEPLLKRAG